MRKLLKVSIAVLALLLVLLSQKAKAYEFNARSVQNTKVAKAITKYAKKYEIEREVLSCVLKVESGYRMNVVSKTFDYGIAQINIRTIKAQNLDKRKLLTDLDYSLNVCAALLSSYKTIFKEDEVNDWVARYNVGYQSLSKGSIGALYVQYNLKIQRCIHSNNYL